jgi:hypothetical protein
MVTESGVFWRSDRPEKKVPGHLAIAENGRPSLEVHGKLIGGEELRSHDADSGVLIFGLMMGARRKVTLVDCRDNGGAEVFGMGADLQEQRIHVGVSIRGAHVTGATEVYSAARLRVAGTDAWANFPPIRRAGGTGIVAPDLDLPETETPAGVVISIDEDLEGTMGVAGGRLTRRIWVKVAGLDNLTLRQIDQEYTTPIASYLRLALGAKSPLAGLELEYQGQWLRVQHPGLPLDAEPTVERGHVFLPLASAGPEVIRGFLDVYKLTGPVAPVLADLLPGGDNLNLQTQVLELTTIAEGVHRNLYKEDERIPEEDAERIRALVKTAIKDESERHRQIVGGSLSYLEEPNYKARMKRLAGEVSTALPGACGNEARWAQVVSDARNSFAHRKEGFLTDESVDEYYAVSQSLRWVLVANLLLRSGVSAETLARATRDNNRYANFLHNVRSALPSVYASRSE